MNTTLSTAPGRHDHPPISPVVETRAVRRVGLVDRVALHLGVALIAWSRRRRTPESRERRAARVEQQLARLERERAAQRWIALNVPRR